jgi:hypothetical protein
MFKQAYLIGKALDGEIDDVYVQGEWHWKKHADTIRAHFSQGIGPRIDKVALHIRRGDYLQHHDFHLNLWETDYYKNAVAMFPPDTEYIVFCRDNQGWEQDKADREWCRLNLGALIGDRFELPDKYNSETDDLNLMASCKSIIMANSSFSWWAAYLGTHEKVIVPKKWFVDGIQRTELLDSWIQI